ncbi:MAG: zinc-ribbon domain-containing protein [Chloroflexi bacterium]|nr:zinc-ribbon domain-containing protein [Chloroflexota bacterium]
MATMNYCPRCGTATRQGAVFCASCGHRLEGSTTLRSGSSPMDGGQAVGTELRYMIPLGRVLFMSVISFGLYVFYWLYLTWKQYRDYTGEEAFPVWHAMTQMVPIYSYFRVHAHMRVFAELMRGENLETTISPGWAVVAVVVSSGISWLSLGGYYPGETTQSTAIVVVVMDTVSVGIIAWLLLHVQTNLNSYWHHRSGGKLLSAKVGTGEVIPAVIGGLLWLDTLASVFSAAYRGGL